MKDWFYEKDNAQYGPVSELKIPSLITSGQIDQTSLIWREGMEEWIPLSDVAEFQTSSEDTSPYAVPGTVNQVTDQHYEVAPPACLVCGILAIIVSCMYIGII